MSLDDLPALISKWLKKREKYLLTLCQSVVPWRCTTRFRPAICLCQLEMVPHCFPIPCTRQDSEGEKSLPLGYMRQIPFVGTSVPPYWLKLRFSHVYIWQCSHFVFHVVRFELWACARAKTILWQKDGSWSNDLLSCLLLLPYFILRIFIAIFPKTDCSLLHIAIKRASFKVVKEFKPESEAKLQPLEIIFAEITSLTGQRILFCFCYRPPSEDPSWMDVFDNFLHEVCDQFAIW